jgi:hypothetical protein
MELTFDIAKQTWRERSKRIKDGVIEESVEEREWASSHVVRSDCLRLVVVSFCNVHDIDSIRYCNADHTSAVFLYSIV